MTKSEYTEVSDLMHDWYEQMLGGSLEDTAKLSEEAQNLERQQARISRVFFDMLGNKLADIVMKDNPGLKLYSGKEPYPIPGEPGFHTNIE